MSVPTQGETFAVLLDHLRKAQEAAATLAHLANANDDGGLARKWLHVSENFKAMQQSLTSIATRRM